MDTQRGVGRDESYEPIQRPGKNYLLSIGIDKYNNWQALSNAVKDAQEFMNVLTSQYQFDSDNVFTLYNEHATEGNIYQALRDMKRRLKPEDNLIIYYSGHGHYDDEIDEGFWIPVDGGRDNESSYISNANIVKRINSLETQHTLLIVDSCFSGSLVVRKRSGVPDERFKSRRILASGRHETVSDGKEGQNSPFAAGLLTYLRQNTSPTLDTTSLIKYVKEYVYGKAKQHPVDGRIQNSEDQGGEFVFHLKRDEEAVWKEVSKANTVAEYRNYLMGFPEGQYVSAANRKINALAEEDIWKSTKISDTELGYEDYIRKYSPSGKYVQDARDRLDQLKTERQERQKVQEEMAARENERATIRETYAELVRDAETLYKDRKLEEAREKYRKALQIHMPGFAPTQEYLEEQINFCQNNMVFLRHYENGLAAMEEKNYRLAINYFQQALTINNNAKVEKLIADCQRHVQGGRQQKQQGNKQRRRQFQGQTVAKPKRRIGLWVGLGSLLTIILLAAIGSMMDSEEIDPDSNNGLSSFDDNNLNIANQDDIANINDDYTNDVKGSTPPPPPPTEPTIGELLIGGWQVNTINVIRNGVAFDATAEDPSLLLLIGAVYNFQPNGGVTVTNSFGTNYLNYALTDTQFYIQADGYGPGVINYIDNRTLQLTLPFTNLYGTHMLQFNLSRQ